MYMCMYVCVCVCMCVCTCVCGFILCALQENRAKVKKQLQEAIETQKRQYKARQEAELTKANRSEHQNIKNRLKDEREYKCRQLYESYKQIMDDLVTQQNVS